MNCSNVLVTDIAASSGSMHTPISSRSSMPSLTLRPWAVDPTRPRRIVQRSVWSRVIYALYSSATPSNPRHAAATDRCCHMPARGGVAGCTPDAVTMPTASGLP